jgi:hypothetical protein
MFTVGRGLAPAAYAVYSNYRILRFCGRFLENTPILKFLASVFSRSDKPLVLKTDKAPVLPLKATTPVLKSDRGRL